MWGRAGERGGEERGVGGGARDARDRVERGERRGLPTAGILVLWSLTGVGASFFHKLRQGCPPAANIMTGFMAIRALLQCSGTQPAKSSIWEVCL